MFEFAFFLFSLESQMAFSLPFALLQLIKVVVKKYL